MNIEESAAHLFSAVKNVAATGDPNLTETTTCNKSLPINTLHSISIVFMPDKDSNPPNLAFSRYQK
jgi:hypothetical protein